MALSGWSGLKKDWGQIVSYTAGCDVHIPWKASRRAAESQRLKAAPATTVFSLTKPEIPAAGLPAAVWEIVPYRPQAGWVSRGMEPQ
ncbi:hypothetical protein A2819_02355 [Candidatus Azambacteria bacterium RIFCSPHIGHO2_01_FULL_40_24]|uniref:Uncharacterized protein n=1 Tax=Candidatus Azambacteria bacterium RIFCSPHIGHO2_01_FULL_40_24 TaxID=1797301 RepID=A0A1F5B525_9BACT|nr:MAG: hypothetical protein A2819_02355 [Candidatus Azambacteria bacterium RIFCSPHIGHO2_01_FULL_40_24]